MAKPYMPSPDAYIRSFSEGMPPAKPGHKIFKRIFYLLIVIVLAIIVFGFYLLMKLGVNPFDPGTLASDQSGRTNILVLGVGDPGHAGQDLSDTNVVVSLDKATKSVAMLSVPRDLRVAIPGYYSAKLNTANSLGGPSLAEQTMSDTLDLPMQYYVVANFTALQQLVDTVGGLDITVHDRLYDPDYPCAYDQYKACGIDIQPGNYHMDGATVLQYVRCRKGTCGNDFGRASRQQEVIALLKQKLLTPGILLNPLKLNALAGIVKSNLKTDMSTNNLVRFVWSLKSSRRTIDAVLSTAPGGLLRDIPGSSDLGPVDRNFSAIQDYAHNIFSDPVLPDPNH